MLSALAGRPNPMPIAAILLLLLAQLGLGAREPVPLDEGSTGLVPPARLDDDAECWRTLKTKVLLAASLAHCG